MADFEKIDNARRVLGFGKEITIDEIKFQFRKLSKKYHPDSCQDNDKVNCEEKFKKINDAYQIVMNYITNYRYSFKKENIQRTKIEKIFHEHLNRFYDGWWGKI